MKNKVISKQTWGRLFAIKNYTEFIQEWLALYDAFFMSNPSIPHELEMKCIITLLDGFISKSIDKCQKNDDFMDVHASLILGTSNIQEIVNPYESK